MLCIFTSFGLTSSEMGTFCTWFAPLLISGCESLLCPCTVKCILLNLQMFILRLLDTCHTTP
ncbi:hypothetical protein IFM89_028290 [Coptis chinensis]|uniref:Uncharacterized protein n=1 Tax=Coptis chinensis TaxID=261450 RepID=A0A835HF29_9MAGN|nr:hypothetical protein IFM89_028290 [Coptis chinensis]